VPTPISSRPGRLLAPHWAVLLASLALFAGFLALGRWQWQRGDERSAQFASFVEADAVPVAASAQTIGSLPRYTRVRVEGTYDPSRQFLLDNRTRDGRAGYEVLTPFALEDGALLLVNRGWIAFSGYRDRPPDVTFEAGGLDAVTGRLDELPTPGLSSGRAPPSGTWPKITTFPTMAELAAALGTDRLASRMLLLDDHAPAGYAREWRPGGLPPSRHYGYAIQWWSFAALLVVLHLVLTLRRRKAASP
jgi:cytochrome oxidase assembly protein ShyY1